MSKNYVQPGKALTVTAPSGGVSSGDVVLLGKLLGIAAHDADGGDPVAIEVEGVFDVAKKSTDVVTVGAILYWDSANSEFTLTSTSNTKAGLAASAAGNGATKVNIKLTPGVA